METDYTLLALCFSTLETFVGLSLSVFIWVVILRGFIKNKAMSSNDKILFVLSISNFLFDLSSICIFSTPSLNSLSDELTSLFVLLYSITSCSWLTACLCFFHFIKIIHFTGGFLARVKVQIDALVPWLILVAEVVSLCSGFIAVAFYVVQTQGIFTNSSIILSMNRMNAIYAILSLFQRVFVILLFFNFIPFLIMTITTFCTVGFLRMHIYRIQRSIGSSSNLESHHGVVTTMTNLLLFYLFFYVAVFAYPYIYAELPYYSYYIYQIMSPSFPLIQSVLLIRANPKLMEAWHQIYLYLKCHKEKVIS